MSSNSHLHLYCHALERGVEAHVLHYLKTYPRSISINYEADCGRTPLSLACEKDDVDLLSFALAHPDIGVNQRCSKDGKTSLAVACLWGSVKCAKLLLDDPRVDVGVADYGGETPLNICISTCHTEIIKHWMISDKPLVLNEHDLWVMRGYAKSRSGTRQNPSEIARWEREMLPLLERWQTDPAQVRRHIRAELAAVLFAVVIFLCDGLLESAFVEGELPDEAEHGALRFLGIARRLPMELQMVLCFRARGLAGTNIPGDLRETAFKNLANTLDE